MKAKSLIPTRRTFQLANLTVIYGFSHPRMAFEHWTRENVHNINAIFFGYLQTTEQEMRKIQLTLTIKNT